MKCRECVKEGQRSTLYSMGASKTLLGWKGPHWDEEGKQHSHDPNRVTEGFKCSRGHQYSVVRKVRCPNPDCDYGGSEGWP